MTPAFTETPPTTPNSPYSASKAACDHLVRAYHHTYGLQVTTSNCSNNYGPLHFPEKLIPLCIAEHAAGPSLPIYGDGRNIRDWLYVDDHCRGIERCCRRARSARPTTSAARTSGRTSTSWTCSASWSTRPSPPTRPWSSASPTCRRRERATAALITFVRDRAGDDRCYAIDAARSPRAGLRAAPRASRPAPQDPRTVPRTNRGGARSWTVLPQLNTDVGGVRRRAVGVERRWLRCRA